MAPAKKRAAPQVKQNDFRTIEIKLQTKLCSIKTQEMAKSIETIKRPSNKRPIDSKNPTTEQPKLLYVFSRVFPIPINNKKIKFLFS